MVVIIIFARGTFDDIYLRLTFGNVCHKKSGLVVNKFLICRFGDSAAGYLYHILVFITHICLYKYRPAASTYLPETFCASQK